jgi:simple sugar transport system ATP-binding protein
MQSSDIVLQMEGICKAFPGVKALSSVDFTLRKGEIHALMGENGAGKSTLIKVLTGVYEIDEGKIIFNGTEITPKSPLDAQRLGISTVYQEVNLCPNLTVAENVFIGRQPMKRGVIDWKEMNSKCEALLKERLNLDIDVRKQLSQYSIAIQQMVAIARAVDISKGVLILDEPTSSLDNNEVKQLFAVMRKLREEGMSMIFVTHFLDQVYEISDRITVLRNGKLVGSYVAGKLTRIELVTKMIGKEIEEVKVLKREAAEDKTTNEALVKCEKLTKKGNIRPFNLEIKKGEIIGFAGLLGSGRTEAAKLIFGADKADQGVLWLDNKIFRNMYPSKAINEGIAFCPEDRKVEGIIGELTIRENIILALQSKKGLLRYIPLKKQQEVAQKYIELLSIATTDMEKRVDNLSGGNQQKVILARWLATNPKLLILDEPTRGIDVGSKTEIQKLILTLAKEGMTILFISSEMEEMVRCCDRIMVLRDKEFIAELSGKDISESMIMDTIANGGVKYA